MSKIVEETKEFVHDLFSEQLGENHLYHNFQHTSEILQRTEELIENSEDAPLNKEHLLLAACLKDTGITRDYHHYLKASCKISKEFLAEKNYPEESINEVCNLILSLDSDEDPEGPEQEILRDAHNYFFAHKDFKVQSELMRREISVLGSQKYSATEWRERLVERFQVEHRYFTKFATENWNEKKKDNLSKLIKSIKKQRKTEKKEKLKVKLKNKSPERAIQTLYRTTLRNHLKLSDIADTKANILLSVNAIIISLLLANLIPTLDDPSKSYLTYPTAIFVLFSVISMIMSVLATRPKIDSSPPTDDRENQQDVNYLFFGNFYAMDLPEFKKTMRGIVDDKDQIYDALATDLYYLGNVLKKKYKLLTWTYTIFITGITLSVIAFAIALKYYGADKVLEAVVPGT